MRLFISLGLVGSLLLACGGGDFDTPAGPPEEHGSQSTALIEAPIVNDGVTTMAGSGLRGRADASSALNGTFNDPAGVAVGADGSVYVADWGNNSVRKITPNGALTTVVPGRPNLLRNARADESAAGSAGILHWTVVSGAWTPTSKATCSTTACGSPYDGSNWFWGGAVANATLTQLADVRAFATAIDVTSQPFHFSAMLRSNTSERARVKVDYLNASRSLIAAGFDSGDRVDPTWTLVSDERFFPPPGTRFIRVSLITRATSGSSADSYFDAVQLRPLPPTNEDVSLDRALVSPAAVAVSPTNELLVGANGLFIQSPSGTFSAILANGAYTPPRRVSSIAPVSDGYAYFVDPTNRLLHVRSPSGLNYYADVEGVPNGEPVGIAVLPRSGGHRVWGAFRGSVRLYAYDCPLGSSSGQVVVCTFVARIGSSHGFSDDVDGDVGGERFGYLNSLAVGLHGDLLIGDETNHAVRRNFGAFTRTSGGAGIAGFLDGNSGVARFWGPSGVAAMPDGGIVVADRINNRIRKILCAGSNICDEPGNTGCQVFPAEDGDLCTRDTCEVLAIRHEAIPIGGSCDDSTVCNGRETCTASGCQTTSAAPAVDDGDRCTRDSCDDVSGVMHTPECVTPFQCLATTGSCEVPCSGPSSSCDPGTACTQGGYCRKPADQCRVDTDCSTGEVCGLGLGPSEGQQRGWSVCVSPLCASDAGASMCGSPESLCGLCDNVRVCATGLPIGPEHDISACSATTTSPEEVLERCVAGAGPRFGLAASTAVCLPRQCLTDTHNQLCGSSSSLCGDCPCTPACSGKRCGDDPGDGCGGSCTGICNGREAGCKSDAECPPNYACVFGGGPRIGLPDGNVCLPRECVSSDLISGVDCGEIASPCGLCTEAPADACAGRECGVDPAYGERCGPDGPGCIQGKLAGHFDVANLNLETLDREDGVVRTLVPLDAPLEDAKAAGAVAGRFEVDAQGHANYTVPIIVPPGRAGLEPRIALSYNSSSRNGLVGTGWAIEGLSAIGRCGKTFATDGWAQAVTFSSADALCLDGKRLVLVEGTSLQQGAKYRAEMDSFDNVQLVEEPVEGSPTQFFRVFTKDGLIKEYGRRRDSRLKRNLSSLSTEVRAWALSRVLDRVGNILDIEYGNPTNLEPRDDDAAGGDTVEFWPSSIAYGGLESSLGVRGHSRVVEFEYYHQRPDYLEGFTANGSRIVRSRLLKAIKTRLLDQELRSYQLAYEAAPSGLPQGTQLAAVGPQRLKSLTECSKRNGHEVCKSPTTFTYSEVRGFSGTSSRTQVGGGQLRGKFIDLDFNGDGARDILVQYDPAGAPEPRWVLLRSSGTRSGSVYQLIQPTTGGSNPKPLFAGDACFSQASIADIDGDGRDDILDTCRKDVQYTFWMGTSDGDDPLSQKTVQVSEGYRKQPRVFLIDVNGDEIKDLFECGIKSLYDARLDPNPEYVESAVYYAGRVNGTFEEVGRGRTTRKGKGRGATNPPGSQVGTLWSYCFSGKHFVLAGEPETPMLVQDVTGDGIDDLLAFVPPSKAPSGGSVVDDSGWGRYVADPDGEKGAWVAVTRSSPSGTAPFVLADLNGDGLRDWISIGRNENGSAKEVRVAINRGGRFEAPRFAGPNIMREQLQGRLTEHMIANAIPIDYDGDGFEDLLSPLEIKQGDPGSAKGLWLWHRAATGAKLHGTLDLDLATLDLNDAAKRSLSRQPEVTPPPDGHVPLLADADGDGKGDLVLLDADGSVRVLYGQFGGENLLTEVRDGGGKVVDIEYGSTTTHSDGERSTYQSPEGCPHLGQRRTKCLKRVGAVVSQYRVLTDPGDPFASTVEARFRYRYEDARDGLYGRGWLGFGKTVIEQLDSVGRLIERQEIVRDNQTYLSEGRRFPFAGLEISRTTSSAPEKSEIEVGEAVARVVAEQQWGLAYSDAGVPFAFVEARTETHDEVLSSGVAVRVRRDLSVVEDIDAYGNVRNRVNVASVGSSSSANQRIVTEFDRSGDRLGQWLVDLKTSEVVEEEVVGTESSRARGSRMVSWTYGPSGLLESITREPEAAPESSLYQRTVFHRHLSDIFQNVRRVERLGAWRDASVRVRSSRSRSFQYDADGIFVRRAIQHVGTDCPVDAELGDADNHELGTTCLLIESSYDPRDGVLIASVDNAGVGSQSGVDAFGRIVQQRLPTDIRLTVYEDAKPEYVGGRLVRAVTKVTSRSLATGQVAVDKLDGLGRLVRTERSGLNGKSVSQEFRYLWGNLVDVESRPHVEGDPTQGDIISEYDKRYRLSRRRYPDGTSVRFSHGARENTVPKYAAVRREATISRFVDRRGHEVVTFRDFRGAPVRSRDAMGNETEFLYDAFGNLGRIRDARGNLTALMTDNLGRVVRHEDQDTGVQTFAYTAFDEPFVHSDGVGSDAERLRRYTYDQAGRLVHVGSPDGETSYVYDVGENSRGRLVESTSAWGHVQRFEYEAMPSDRDPMKNSALLASATHEIGGETFRISYEYSGSRVARVEFPRSANGTGFALRYGYDGAGNLNAIIGSSADQSNESALLWRRGDDYQGYRTRSERFGDGLDTTYEYDSKNGRAVSLATRGMLVSSFVQDIQYSQYDPNGNLLARRSSIRRASGLELETVEETFGYDELERLRTVVSGGVTQTFEFDELGNITSKPGVGTYVYREDGKVFRPHAVQSILRGGVKVVDLEYDAYGNVRRRSGEGVTGGAQDIDYTSFNLPSSVEFADGREVSYEYDASGSRTVEKSQQCTAGAPCFERLHVGDIYTRETGTDGAGTFVRDTYRVRLGERLLAEVVREARGEAVVEHRRFSHGDELGSPQVITDASGAVLATRRYSPYGEVSQEGALSPANVVPDFTGHRLDAETRLVDMGGRTYDPMLGRFLQADPAGMESPLWSQGLNRYSYVGNNPVNRIDPTGFEGESGTAYPEEGYWDSDSIDHILANIYQWDREINERNAAALEGNADALWAEIQSSELAQADTGNPNMDLLGVQVAPSPVPFRWQPTGPGDKINPYDYHRSGTSLFGTERPRQAIVEIQPGELLFELHPASSIYYLQSPTATSGERAVAIVSLLPIGRLLRVAKIGVLASVGVKGARGLGQVSRLGGRFVSEANAAGGTVITSVGRIEQADFVALVDEALQGGETVYLLTGVHGLEDGTMVPAEWIFRQDFARWAGEPGVHVLDVGGMAAEQIGGVLNGTGTIVGAFCDSGACLSVFR